VNRAVALALLFWPAWCAAAGLDSAGNTDGVLTWRLGALTQGKSAREVVLFAFDSSPEAVAKRLEAARKQFATLPEPPAVRKPGAPKVWIRNDATDFALEETGYFRWRNERQALAGSHGGQLSQFTWYVHYQDAAGGHRAGTPHVDPSTPENLRIVEPVRPLGETEAVAVIATADGKLHIRVRAAMGSGPAVAVEFLLTNAGAEPLSDVTLTSYANLESAHTHEGDYSVLDARSGGLLVCDPPTGICCVMAGLGRPATGYSGTWCSLPQLQAAEGVPFGQWKPFAGMPAGAKALTRQQIRANPPPGIYLPPIFGEPATPETRTLAEAEAKAALERDWLFQAMGEPLLPRAAREIGWTRELAARLARAARPPDLAADLKELDALDIRLGGMTGKGVTTPRAASGGAVPCWIWFPEGRPAEDAPAEARLFRCTFDAPAGGVRAAGLRITADDSCEVFLNGARIGAHDTWEQAAAFAVEKQLKPGRNVLAVRAANKPFAGKNPAGLIAVLSLVLADGKQMAVVSDAAWRTAKEERPGWQEPGFGDSAWKAAAVAAPLGGGPWGRSAGLVEALEPTAAYSAADPGARGLYLAVRQVKRRIALRNPVVGFTQLLFIDQPYPTGPETRHEAIHRMGIWATPGGRLLVLDGLHPGGALRQLAPDKPGSFWRPDLSFDAKRVLFCYKPHDEKSFHLYEMGLDGAGLRQLTSSDYDDADPIYLPDGHIMFVTTRGNSYVRCGPFIYSYLLARCDADGGNIYLISMGGEPDWTPAVLPDGRVIYSRWEYTDKPLWRVQSLWTTNQDGTNTTVFWGNQSVWPDHLSEPMPIPGSRRVMFSGVGHHDWWSGSIGIIDPDKGFNFPDGLTKVTADLRWAECSTPPIDPHEAADYHPSGRFTGYKTAYPLSEQDFLVSARGEGGKFRLYLMDVTGNRDLIYEGVHNILHAMPVRPRPVPPPQPDRVAWPGTGKDRKPPEPGVFFSADVCQGVPDLPRGSVKHLRVWQMDHKTYSTWRKTYRHSGPPVSIVQEEGVKRILSEVPVEADGSVHFTVPAGRALHFQLLDEHYRCLQTMRSFTGVMPGEVRGCLGCHELHSASPAPRAGTALGRPPTEPTPPPWGTESIAYERFVQPVLDRYCGKCHQGDGKGRAKLDLTLRPGASVFKEPYLTLVGAAGWGNPARGGRPGYGIANALPVETLDPSLNNPQAYATFRPMAYLSYSSKLVDIAMSGKHNDVKVDPLSLRRLIAWVDACCPYMGDPELRALGDPDFPGIDELPIRPRVQTAPVVQRP